MKPISDAANDVVLVIFMVAAIIPILFGGTVGICIGAGVIALAYLLAWFGIVNLNEPASWL